MFSFHANSFCSVSIGKSGAETLVQAIIDNGRNKNSLASGVEIDDTSSSRTNNDAIFAKILTDQSELSH